VLSSLDADLSDIAPGRAVLRDLTGWRCAEGERPANLEQTLKFGAALGKLAARDAAVHKLTAEVQHLLKPRSVYQDPALVQRVLAEMGR
jgi:hypothetical protein